MPNRPKSPAAKRQERRRLNRLARVRAALEAGDDTQYLLDAIDFVRAAIKRVPPEERAGHRRAVAELLVNYALNELESSDFTRLEAVA